MELALLIILIFLSAFFSSAETAFFSLDRATLLRLEEGSRAGRRVAKLVAGSHEFLSALLIGNLIVNIAASVVVTSICLRQFGSRGLAIAVPATTIGLLILGEITPKMIALRFRLKMALMAGMPLALWVWVTRPILWLVGVSTRSLVRRLPMKRTGMRPLTSPELETACDEAVADGSLTSTEGHFLARLLLLQHLEARRIMTPRPEVVTVGRQSDRQKILQKARKAGFNRYPVMESDELLPKGFIHLRDLLVPGSTESACVTALRPLLFVPESKRVNELLSEMRADRTHLAGVVDEHGDFSGIVTMADCLRALMGQVGDDHESVDVSAIGEDVFVVGGRADLRQVNEECGVRLPSSRDYLTIGGLIMASLGRIPQPGDEVGVAGVTLRVLEMDVHRVVSVRVDLARAGEETS